MNAKFCANISLVLVALSAASACVSSSPCDSHSDHVSIEEEMLLLADDTKTLGGIADLYLEMAPNYNDSYKSAYFVLAHAARVLESTRKNIIKDALSASDDDDVIPRDDLLRAHEKAFEAVTPYLERLLDRCHKHSLTPTSVDIIEPLLVDRINGIEGRCVSRAGRRAIKSIK